MKNLRIGFVVTAAGLSRRHPPNKLLLPLNGGLVIQKTVSALLSLPYSVCVVSGYEAAKIRNALSSFPTSQIRIVENPDYASGMAGSLKTGILALPDELDYFGFLPGDKPFVTAETIHLIIRELAAHNPEILIPTYRGQNGHPTFFHTTFRDSFTTLTGDTGGREIITRYPLRVRYLPLETADIVMDMDRWLEEQVNDAEK